MTSNIKQWIPTVEDWPKPGVSFLDICGLLHEPRAYRSVIEWAVKICSEGRFRPTSIIATESRGFIFAAPVALELGVPLILVRKPDKLPGSTYDVVYDTEYSTDRLSIQQSAPVGSAPVIIDDILATGGTVMAVRQLLIDNFDVDNVTAVIPIVLSFLPGVAKLLDNDVELYYHTSYDE